MSRRKVPAPAPALMFPMPVIKAYSGRPGCACGCRGTYYLPTGGPSARRMIARITKIVNAAEGVETWNGAHGAGATVEVNGRVYSVYVSVHPEVLP